MILDSTIHDADTLRFILGTEPTSVIAFSQQANLASGELEDGVMAVLRFENKVLEAGQVKVTPHDLRLAAWTCSLGSALEYYDFALYSLASALIFAPLFFPQQGHGLAQIESFGTYFIGFAIRPVGGIIFGALGDRLGRKFVLVTTVVFKDVGDLSQVHDFTRRAAGAELNVAIGLARLGFRVGWVSGVGSDSFGRFICDVLDRERVDRQSVIVDPAFPTGFQLKSRGIGNQDPLVEYFRRGSAASHLSVADFDPEYFLSARHLHVTGIAPALSKTSLELAHHAIDQMRAAGKSISFDPGCPPAINKRDR